jgi:hypothetical protein
VQLDANDAATEHEVRLVGPWITDAVEPSYNEFDGVMECDITIRTADGSAFSYPYYPSLADT